MGPQGPDLAQRLTMYTHKLAHDEAFSSQVHVLTRPGEDMALASLTAAQLSTHEWQAIFDWSTHPSHHATILDDVPALMRAWLESMTRYPTPPRKVLMRLNQDRSLHGFDDMLQNTGWQRGKGRVEFKTPLDQINVPWRGPLTWRSLAEVGEEATARIIDEAGRGPEWEPEDRGDVLLKEYMEGIPEHESIQIEVGYLEQGRAVAFVIARVDLKDGWCTLPFMGITPSSRGDGLGKWVHRRGLEMMRQQGGKLYHGGTSSGNVPMLALFSRHGCAHHAHLVEWTYLFEEA